MTNNATFLKVEIPKFGPTEASRPVPGLDQKGYKSNSLVHSGTWDLAPSRTRIMSGWWRGVGLGDQGLDHDVCKERDVYSREWP